MSELSAKHERFVAEYMRDCNPAAAAQRAGYSPRYAPHLLATKSISDEIERRQAVVAAAVGVTVAGLIDEAEAARVLARGEGNASAMVSATMLKAKLSGLLIEKTEDVVRRDEAARKAQERGELKTAADLIANAAQSLGLPRTATPAQIVGSLAGREIATPEMFELLHVAQGSDDAAA